MHAWTLDLVKTYLCIRGSRCRKGNQSEIRLQYIVAKYRPFITTGAVVQLSFLHWAWQYDYCTPNKISKWMDKGESDSELKRLHPGGLPVRKMFPYVHGFSCFVMVTLYYDLFYHILQGYFTGTGAIVRLLRASEGMLQNMPGTKSTGIMTSQCMS